MQTGRVLRMTNTRFFGLNGYGRFSAALKLFVISCGGISIFTASLAVCSSGYCDRIVLKDGSVEQSRKVWVSEGYVHFILEGTRNVEIRYAREIVARIESDSLSKDSKLDEPAVRPLQNADESGQKIATAAVPQRSAVENGSGMTPGAMHSGSKIVTENKGIGFYDPHRPLRYWAYSGSRHSSLQGALASVAKLYGKSVQWVIAHMGEENDLGVIHFNLTQQAERESTPPGVPFRDDLSIDSKDSHAPNGIQKSSDETIKRTKPGGSALFPDISAVKRGTRFYDPRRAEKYWSGQMTRHNTLKEAIDALARQYGVSSEWIEKHMGATNELLEIHGNIRQVLNSP